MKSGPRALLLFLIVSIAPTTPSFAELPPGFPSAGLEDRVAFWEKVFTIYGEDDYIIHDNFRVNLIYDVVPERERRSRMRSVRATLDQIRRKIATPERMNAEERRIYDLIAETDVKLTAGNIAVLRQRVHAQRGIKERFRSGIIKSGRYLPYFEQVFEELGVPTVITLLPLVESSFENRAYSSAGAAGIWQFTRSTGRLYMRVVRGRDDRLNPAIATRSAARLLKTNYERLRSWPLAISAYNHGRAGMARARSRHGSDLPTIIRNYRSRSFGYASKNFYAEFVAAVNVYQNYEKYFGLLALDPPEDFSNVPTQVARRRSVADSGVDGARYRVRYGDTLGGIANRHGTSVNRLMDLNGLPTDVIFAGETLLVSVSDAPAAPPSDGRYRVRWGDTLSEIARRFGVGLRELMDLNGLRNSTIYAGQILVVR
jgi:membrane-bound lytic murein transglycosylase D